jgi:hypothetical protein
MRTTLNLDTEVLSTVRLLSKQSGLPIGAIVSEIVRKALQHDETAVERNGVQIFPRKEGPAPDIATVNKLRD